MRTPVYSYMDKVEFCFNGTGEPLTGLIEVVDANGTLEQSEEVFYDIYVGADRNCLYKHVPESHIRRRLISESITRGILQYHEKENIYTVKYNSYGYEAVLDNPSFTEIRLTGMKEWISVALVENELPESVREREKDWLHLPVASLREWIGKSVEIRYMPPYMQVCELIFTHQDNSDMIYEVYREDTNVVLYDGGFVVWKPENLVLRGAKHHVLEYYQHQVFRWDVVDGVMRLCLGPIPDPSPDVLRNIEDWIKRKEAREARIPRVPENKKQIVERLRRSEFATDGLKRMISHANYIGRTKSTEILTPITKNGFEYRIGDEWHKVYYQPEYIIDAIVSENKARQNKE